MSSGIDPHNKTFGKHLRSNCIFYKWKGRGRRGHGNQSSYHLIIVSKNVRGLSGLVLGIVWFASLRCDDADIRNHFDAVLGTVPVGGGG